MNRPYANLKPFLRWVGGKQKIVKHLISFIPEKYNNYHEPFVGSGALFFYLGPKKAYLSDCNGELINCYCQIRDNPDRVYQYLLDHVSKTSEEYYYYIREKFNACKIKNSAQAGRFLYLNRTNFNGIYRVNLKGKYNVPYGKKEPPPIPTYHNIKYASLLLRNVELMNDNFQNSMKNNISENDFIYLDPPYPPISKINSNFNHYTDGRFSWKDQIEVAKIATKYIKNCYIMVSNSDIPEVRSLYEELSSEWKFSTLPVRRFVSANGQRKMVNEIVITNY